jgi:(2S)-methylsuccinyl-CoA dehydrogenase
MIPDRLDKVVEAVADLVAKARDTLAHRMEAGGGIDPAALEREQHALRGLAWLATYGETLKSVAAFARQLAEADRFTEIERLLTGILFGEYLEQIIGGIPMNQQEFARPGHLGLEAADLAALQSAAAPLIAEGSTSAARARLVQLMIETRSTATFGDCGLDETLDQIRGEMRRFVDSRVAPHAHAWHRANAYVPLALIEELAGLGVFALTLPEEHGGMGLGKEAMCVVSEELSRGWIAVGSLGTRAARSRAIILAAGTDEQKRRWLPRLATGEILPTAASSPSPTRAPISPP